MTEEQWDKLRRAILQDRSGDLLTAFIIDSPWLPGWAGVSVLDYLVSESIWLESNLKAMRQFPEVIFLPGFWSEFGMCTEPSAFGSVCKMRENEFPHPAKAIESNEAVDDLVQPDPRTDGFLPLVIKRLQLLEPRIQKLGQRIYFAVSRGPLNIASYLMGTTEFLMLLKLEPERAHRLLSMVTQFVSEWLEYQKECFPSIEGIMLLDDIVGFLGPEDVEEFVDPYLKKAFSALDVPVRFFHNDASCEASAPFYESWGVNLYNPGIESTLDRIFGLAGETITILGNIPPRDVLAAGTPTKVRTATSELVERHGDSGRLIVSCAGGMPPGVTTENIEAVVSAVNDHRS